MTREYLRDTVLYQIRLITYVFGQSDKATGQGILAEAVPTDGTIVSSDKEWSYHGIEPQHATVNHAQHAWARDDDGVGEVHCTRCEAAGAALRTFLRPFRGVHTANLH
jgi:transposase